MKKDDAKQLADQAITALQEELKAGRSESLLKYLDAMSRFHNFSWNNCSADCSADAGGNLCCRLSPLAADGTACPERRNRNRNHGTTHLSQSR